MASKIITGDVSVVSQRLRLAMCIVTWYHKEFHPIIITCNYLLEMSQK